PYLRLLSIVIRHSTRSTLFPYTTLFRSSSGTFRFFISADDEAQFIFSTTASSADAQVVASVPRYSSRNQFDKYSSQASPIFNLEAGKRYYFEVIHREGYGGDHFSVAWEGPGITQSIVAGDYLYS